MKDRRTIGGSALPGGVMMRSERYSATAKFISEGCYELSEKENQQMPAIIRFVARIPILRGLMLPILLFYSLDFSSRQLEGWEKLKIWQRVLLWVLVAAILVALCLPTFILGTAFFPPGIVRNIFIFFPVFVPFLIVAFCRNEQVLDILMYHGAEHKAVHAYEVVGEPVTLQASILGSRFHPRCSTTLITNFILTMFACSLLWPTMYPCLIFVLAQVVSTEISQFTKSGFLSRIVNMFGMAAQNLTTVEPEEKHLRAAMLAINAVLELEGAESKPELPRERRISI